MVLCVTRFFHSRFFSLRKFNFNVNFVTLPSSHLEKILSRFFFVVKAKIYRQLCFFFTSVLSRFFSLSKLRFTANCVFFHFGSFTLGFFSLSKQRFTANCIFFHFSSFTLLKPNFKADPISKVTFHFGFFTLLNPNFKADPISKVFSCC
ncbi:unnamed protein product [Rhizophagus irregularis]|nr:unnamed protein product [Rhizophagus irregularis]CAB4444250.1 unnamed protein product [Rhizophagus irregularis]